MPTSTFFHLPPEKQRKLLRSAVREFSQQPYGEVPLSRIIAGAEIPRGSFYQYFADKTDLFVYVLSHYGHQLKQLPLRCLADCEGDLLALPLALFDAMDGGVCPLPGRRSGRCCPFCGHNAGFDAGRMCQPPGLAGELLAAARNRQSGSDGAGGSAGSDGTADDCRGQAVAGVACGLPPEKCRERLERKTALLRRGAAKQEDTTCCK